MAPTIKEKIANVSDGPWIETASGRLFHFQCIDPDEIDIEDIAHALARLCRYTGHVNVEHYSVAQHSILVSNRMHNKLDRLAGLLHDAQEAYIGDVNSPLKSLLHDYQVIEGNIVFALIVKYGITKANWQAVEQADRDVGYAEARAFMPNKTGWAGNGPFYIKPMSPYEAEVEFLNTYKGLTK